MEGVKLVVPVDLVGGNRVCEGDSSIRQSDVVLGFTGSKIEDGTSFVSNGGTSAVSGSMSWTKKQNTESYGNKYLLSRCTTEASQGGLSKGSISLISGYDGKEVHRKVGGKVPRNGSGSLRKLRLVQADNVLPPGGNADAKMELDILGSHLVKCSNADKSQAVKQRNSINSKRNDRRNSKVLSRAKFDQFPMLAGMSSSPVAGGSNTFGMYGLKPDVHDVTKNLEDISLNELLDRTYKCPSIGKDKGKKPASVNDNVLVLDTVRKVCSLIQIQGSQLGKQSEEVDIHAHEKTPSSTLPSNIIVDNESDADGRSAPSSSKLDMELEVEDLSIASAHPVYQPRDILEKLALPPTKDLDSLLQDAVKSAASMKPTDSRSNKQLSRVSLPPFQWSHNFSGHHKPNNDPLKSHNRNNCLGRWVRITSTASFIGGGAESFVDLESLTYDDSLVPVGQLRYRIPENGMTSSVCASQHDASSVASPAASLPPLEPGSTPHPKMDSVHSPRVMAAARTLCEMATYCLKYNSGGMLKWPKQPSQKAMKARKSRLSEIPEEEFLTPKSETVYDHVVRSVEPGSSSKRHRILLPDRREETSHVQAVIGLSSVSAPRSNRSSPSRLSRDSISEPRDFNGSYIKSQFSVPPPVRALERSRHTPQKLRKVTPMDWHRSRS